MTATNTNNKYTFKTIVAPEAVRADFTALRDQLGSSDKELMQALWNLGIDRLEDLKKEVAALQEATALARSQAKELKAAAKQKDKEVTVAKRATKDTTATTTPKTKRTRKTVDAPVVDNSADKVNTVESDDGDMDTVVVIGG